MFKQFTKFFSLIFISLALTACVSQGLSHKQKKLLQKEGFSLTEEGWSLALPEQLLFEFNSYDIADNKKPQISHLSETLRKYNLQKLKIVGHTDDVGTSEYNLSLSEKRAETIKNIFIENGYKNENIQTVGRGSTQPLTNNSSEDNRANNRRVNIIIIP